MPRLPYADYDALPADVRERIGSAGAVLNVTRMIAHTGETVAPWTEVIYSLLGRDDLPPALRELAILRVGYRLDSAYEHAHHVGLGRKAGLSKEAIATVCTDEPDATILGSDGQAIVEVVDQLLATGHVDDDAFAAMHSILGDENTVTLLLMIGIAVASAYVLNGTQVEVDEAARANVASGPSQRLAQGVGRGS